MLKPYVPVYTISQLFCGEEVTKAEEKTLVDKDDGTAETDTPFQQSHRFVNDLGWKKFERS